MQCIGCLNASYFDWYLQSSNFMRYLNKTHKRLSHENCRFRSNTHKHISSQKIVRGIMLEEELQAERNRKMEQMNWLVVNRVEL